MAHVRTALDIGSHVRVPGHAEDVRRFRMLDHVFDVRTDVPGLPDVMDRLFAPFRLRDVDGARVTFALRVVDDPKSSGRYEMYRDDESVGRVSSIGLLLDYLIRETTTDAASTTTRYVTIHAGAASSQGRAVIFPAPGGQGKTTTVAALTREGWNFLTDEAALISFEDGLIHPFPRPLSISPSSIKLFPGLKERLPAAYEPFRHFDHRVTPDDLRPGCVSGPVPLAFVVLPSYTHGSTTMLMQISPAEALVELLKGSFNLDLLGRKAVEMLTLVVERVPCYRLSIGSLEPAVQAIQGLLTAQGAAIR